MNFRGGPVRTAAEVIAGLPATSSLAEDRHQELQIRTMGNKAREMLEHAFAADGEMELSNELLEVLDQVFEAENESKAIEALDRLRQGIMNEKKKRQDALRAEREREIREKAEDQRETARRVAEQIAAVLEDLGYSVSGIDETAFVEKGHLYAGRTDFHEHVLRFELDPDGQAIKSVPLRVLAERSGDVLSEESARRQDIEFDQTWCSADALKKFRDGAAARGVGVKFKAERKAGTQTLQRISERELGETLQRARKPVRKTEDGNTKPRTRNRP